MDFLRHKRSEWYQKKRTTFGSTFILFLSVELTLQRLLPSRALVRFTQLNKYIYLKLTQFIEQTLMYRSLRNF